MVIFNSQKNITCLAGDAAKILGLQGRQKSVPTAECLPPELRNIVGQVSASGKPAEVVDIPVTISGRGAVRLDVSAAPLAPGKRNEGVAVYLADLSLPGQPEQYLLRLNRLATIGTFSASVAHEIKNALVAGKTFIDLLIEKHPDAELGAVVRREMGRIDAIVSGMLKYAGPSRPTLGPVRLHDLLEQSLRLIEPQMHHKSVALSRSFHAAPDVVQADGQQLQQAFVNLFLNALEAMGSNGALTVETETAPAGPAGSRSRLKRPASGVLVTIKDTGPGISSDSMRRLFEPFFTTKEQGTGLGLAITQHIIEEHHGTIRAESGPGTGAVFRIVLPTSAAHT